MSSSVFWDTLLLNHFSTLGPNANSTFPTFDCIFITTDVEGDRLIQTAVGNHLPNFSIFLLCCSSEERLKPWFVSSASNDENERAKKAYEAVLTVTAISSSRDTPAYQNFEQGVKSLSKSKFNYDYEGPVNNFVANFHDAVNPPGL